MVCAFIETLRDTFTDVIETKQDKYHNAIVSAFKKHADTTDKPAQFKDIYYTVCKNLEASDADASKGIAPCPYTGQKKDIKGLIRSWVEERSPHSRQYYWRGGKRVIWTEEQRPLLFVNWGLAKANAEKKWMPYNHVRGNGWILDPMAAKKWVQPSDEILRLATAAYRKTGMQGSPRTPSAPTVIIRRRVVNILKPFRACVT